MRIQNLFDQLIQLPEECAWAMIYTLTNSLADQSDLNVSKDVSFTTIDHWKDLIIDHNGFINYDAPAGEWESDSWCLSHIADQIYYMLDYFYDEDESREISQELIDLLLECSDMRYPPDTISASKYVLEKVIDHYNKVRIVIVLVNIFEFRM